MALNERPLEGRTELAPQTFGRLVSEISERSQIREIVEIDGRKPLFVFYNHEGIELDDLLDSEHKPSVTKVQTLVISEEFSGMRGDKEKRVRPEAVEDINGDIDNLIIISTIASDTQNYEESDEANVNRGMYLAMAARSLEGIYIKSGVGRDDVLVGVKRCGSNILGEIGANGVDVEAKRYRFEGLGYVLGAGTNISREVAARLEGKDVRLAEGVIAAGSTEIAIMSGLKMMGVNIKSISCDAVVVCPQGADYVSDVRRALEYRGIDRGAFVGGILDEKWYVRYGKKDRLLPKLISKLGNPGKNFIGDQVLGDGGDLTSNTSI